MEWTVEWGPRVDKLIEMEAATGQPSKALNSAPILDSTAQEVASAYSTLSSRRTAGMAANPIQLSEIRAYIDLFGSPSISIDVFVDLIGRMDSTYLELSRKNSVSNNPSGKR